MTGPWIVALVALWVVVTVNTLLLLGVLRRIVPVLQRAEQVLQDGGGVGAGTGLAPGATVPDFEVRTSHGEVHFSELVTERAAVFVFVDAHCAPCQQLTTELAMERGSVSQLRLHLITDEPLGKTFPDGVVVLHQAEDAASSAFEQSAFPQAFVVDGDRKVIERTFPNTMSDLQRLADRAVSHDERLRTPANQRLTRR